MALPNIEQAKRYANCFHDFGKRKRVLVETIGDGNAIAVAFLNVIAVAFLPPFLKS